MNKADIIFFRTSESVEIRLFMDGHNILNTSSLESIVRELQIRQVAVLGIEDLFSVDLPTTKASLTAAEGIRFSEPWAALKVIAACAAVGDISSYAPPERRAIPRPEKLLSTITMH